MEYLLVISQNKLRIIILYFLSSFFTLYLFTNTHTDTLYTFGKLKYTDHKQIKSLKIY